MSFLQKKGPQEVEMPTSPEDKQQKKREQGWEKWGGGIKIYNIVFVKKNIYNFVNFRKALCKYIYGITRLVPSRY